MLASQKHLNLCLDVSPCLDSIVYKPILEIRNATVYPIHNTECPLLIKCHGINMLLCSDWGKIEGKCNKQFWMQFSADCVGI